MATKQLLPDSNQGVAVQADSVPVGPISQDTVAEGAQQNITTIVGTVRRLNFGPGFSVELSEDGTTATITLA